MSFFKYFAIAIAKPKQYHKFMKVSLKKAMLYLLLVITLATIPTIIYSYKNSKDMYPKLKEVHEILKNDVPDFEFKDEKVNIKDKTNIDKEVNGIRLIVNKDKDYSTEEIKNMKSVVLLDKNKLIIEIDGKMTGVIANNFKDKNTLTKETYIASFEKSLLNPYKNASKMGIQIIAIEFTANYIQFFILTAIVAALCIFTTKSLFIKMEYKELFKLASFAMTTSVILDLVLKFVPMSNGMFKLLIIVMSGLIYMWFGLKHIKLNGYAEEIPYKEEPKRVKPKL